MDKTLCSLCLKQKGPRAFPSGMEDLFHPGVWADLPVQVCTSCIHDLVIERLHVLGDRRPA